MFEDMIDYKQGMNPDDPDPIQPGDYRMCQNERIVRRITDSEVQTYANLHSLSIETAEEYHNVMQLMNGKLKMGHNARIEFAEQTLKNLAAVDDLSEVAVIQNKWREFLSDNGYPPMTAGEFLGWVGE
jgi:hypothetical protein